MAKAEIKQQMAESTAEAFSRAFPDVPFDLPDAAAILAGFETPKDPTMGRFALPVFRFAKQLRQPPNKIAESIVAALPSVTNVAASAAGGFVNYAIAPALEAAETLRQVLSESEQYGTATVGAGKTILVEYSSCNIAKPFGIGHLRTTILGNSLRRIFLKLGYHAVGINYLGDWGTQFGKMIVAFEEWGQDLSDSDATVDDLVALYVRFHREVEDRPELDDRARDAFRKLEAGDPAMTGLWSRFKDISIAEFKRIYDLMGVEFDWITGEAFLNDKMDPVIERLERAGLTSISKGALIVDLHDEQLPPALLRKADGATLYLTRDVAGLIYRFDHYHFDEALYVVASAQSDHFKQVFRVVEMLEQAEGIKGGITGRTRHVDFGWVRFGEEAFSTRKGVIIKLEEVINRAVDLVRERIREKNPNLAAMDSVADMVGIGAVLFSQLSVRRQKDVNFDWDEVLSFEGETGPYLQYTHARLCSLMRNYGSDVTADVDYNLLGGEEERRVVELLADFPDVIHDAARMYEPNFIAAHLLKLAGAFNKMYQRKDVDGRSDKIIDPDRPAQSAARMALVKSVQIVVREGLHLLGLKAPEEM